MPSARRARRPHATLTHGGYQIAAASAGAKTTVTPTSMTLRTYLHERVAVYKPSKAKMVALMGCIQQSNGQTVWRVVIGAAAQPEPEHAVDAKFFILFTVPTRLDCGERLLERSGGQVRRCTNAELHVMPRQDVHVEEPARLTCSDPPGTRIAELTDEVLIGRSHKHKIAQVVILERLYAGQRAQDGQRVGRKLQAALATPPHVQDETVAIGLPKLRGAPHERWRDWSFDELLKDVQGDVRR